MKSSFQCNHFQFLTTLLLTIFTVSLWAHDDNHGNRTSFIQNQGQWEGPFSYKAQFDLMTVFAESNGFSFLLREPIPHHDDPSGIKNQISNEKLASAHAFRLRFVGANEISFTGQNQQKGYHNYLLGNDRSKWKGHVPLYSELLATDIYPDIDMIVYSGHNSFKYDFIIHPNIDPGLIRFNYTGADIVEFAKDRIVIRTVLGDITESIPSSYQMIDGVKIEVKCFYIRHADGFGFVLPQGYNTNYSLIIDPVLVASTLSGTASAGGTNYGHGATFDQQGNIYTHAISFNSGYPTDDGSFQEAYGGGNTDAVISKLNPDGSELIFATFIGGSGDEHPHSTIVNLNGEIFVFGSTSSSNFPTTIGAVQPNFGGVADIFITGLSVDGSAAVGSTYLGGSANDGRNEITGGYDTFRGEINVNVQGEIFITSLSSSADFPVTAGVFQEDKKDGQDAVVVKLNSNLSQLVWSGFLGSEGNDMAYGIRNLDNGNVVVCGAVSQVSGGINEFPVTANAFQQSFGGGNTDGFVTVFSNNATEVLYSTFLGLNSNDLALFLDLDSDQNIWIYMDTQSNWPITAGVWGTATSNVLVHKLSGDLSEKLVTSYLSNDAGAFGNPVAFMVDLCDGIYISAYGTSGGFVASSDALFQSGGFYLGVYEADMTGLIYGTYYTGNHVDGGTSRFDTQGIVYQGVCSGGGFNTTPNAWSNTQPGWDIGVFKIDFEIESVNAVAGASGYLIGCAPHTVVFQNFSSGVSYEWLYGDGNSSDDFEPQHVYEEPGDYLVMLLVNDPESCNLVDTAYIPITVIAPAAFYPDFTAVVDCGTGFVNITNNSAGPTDVIFEWNMGDGTFYGGQDIAHTYANPGQYDIILSMNSVCFNDTSQTVEVFYLPELIADFSHQVVDFCVDNTVTFYDLTLLGTEYLWSMGDGNTVTSNGTFDYQYALPGLYEVQLIATNPAACNISDTATYEIDIPAQPILTPEITATQFGLCNELSYQASVEPNGPAETFIWTLDGEEVGSTQSIESTVNLPGNYTLMVTVFDAICDNPFSTQISLELIETLGFELPPAPILCYYDESLDLDATVPYDAVYDWNNGLSVEPILTVTSQGTYSVEVAYNGCIEQQQSTVTQGPEYPLAFSALICEGQPNIVPFEDFPGIDTLNWANGQTGFFVQISQSGYYSFTAIDQLGCYQIDSLQAIPRNDDPQLDIPNVFTPNGDGLNDRYQIQGDSLVYFALQIYNRWGTQVFETEQMYGYWDGTYSGHEAGDDVFMYVLKYRDFCDLQDNVLTGHISILR